MNSRRMAAAWEFGNWFLILVAAAGFELSLVTLFFSLGAWAH